MIFRLISAFGITLSNNKNVFITKEGLHDISYSLKNSSLYLNKTLKSLEETLDALDINKNIKKRLDLVYSNLHIFFKISKFKYIFK